MDFDKNFVVHNYSVATSTPPSQSLLHAGYELIRDPHSESLNWVNVAIASVPSSIIFYPTKELVQYPPFTENFYQERLEDQNNYVDVSWGPPLVGQDDVFSLKHLEDFRSTDLGFVLDIRSEQTPSNLKPTLSQQLPTIEKGSLHGVIPQPHVHPSSSSKLIGSIKLVPYTKATPILIPPRTEPFLPSPYSRSTWLIPVRGKPPWEQCTAALVLDSYDASHLDLRNREEIVWTPVSIRSFWDFLLEVKASGSAGAIGLSFHASRNATLVSPPNYTESLVMPENQQSIPPSNVTSHLDSVNPNLPHRVLLLNLDYIKIYHEGLHAMHLRHMLHLWSYTEPQLGGKIRILKEAILALMDERARGILLS